MNAELPSPLITPLDQRDTKSAAEAHDRKASDFLSNPTQRYVAGASARWWGYASSIIDGSPFFTWMDIPRMLRDPKIQFGLRMLRAPFQQVKWTVRAESQRIADYVHATLKRFWRRAVPLILDRYFKWGYAPGGLEFREERGRIKFDRFTAIEPYDASVLVHASSKTFAGYRVQGLEKTTFAPHAYWFAGHGEYDRFYDRPRLAGAFEPWLEKNGRNGARHGRRLWFWKHATGGPILYHPIGTITINLPDGTTKEIDASDLATEILEKVETGANLRFPNEPNANEPSKYAWDYQPPESRHDIAGLREYPSDLDKEMLTGLGIPPEVLEASETGSGWSGRTIPALAYFGSVDELAALLIDSAESMLIRPLVDLNFGSNRLFEIEAVPLAETLLGKTGPNRPEDAKGVGQEGSDPTASANGSGNGGDQQFYQGPRGGIGKMNPLTGRVVYRGSGSNSNSDSSQLSGLLKFTAGDERRIREEAAELARARSHA